MRSSTAGAPPEAAARAALAVYRIGGIVLSPLLAIMLSRRASRGKEDRPRIPERHGRATLPRPSGRLIWVHAASVGETNAVMPLIGRLTATGRPVLFTTTTVTSARLAAARLPAGAVHQFVPLDVAGYVDRFLRHWRPELAVFAESELWPTMLEALAATGVPLVIANARMSDRSFRKWRRFGGVARSLFSRIGLCLARSRRDGERYAALGAPSVAVTGDLKFDVAPLAADAAELGRLRSMLGGRPVWVAASTHDGEEAVVADAHLRLVADHPDAVTIVVPRHPDRGAAVAAMLAGRGIATARRSQGEGMDRATAVYVADTLGELGLFYRLAPVAFLGGSLIPHGGQNPIEPARLGAAVLHGPHVGNFADVYAALDRDGIATPVADAGELALEVARLIDDPEGTSARAARAGATLAPFAGALDATMAALAPYLDARPQS
jgi:3-deoxy-D-manno-octulosonic-acid transferase